MAAFGPAWRTPTGGASLTSSDRGQFVSYAGGWWCAITRNGSDFTVRVTQNPAGAWTSVSMPAAPSGYTTTTTVTGPVVSDGTSWGFLAYYSNGSAIKCRILHASSPTGTWSSYEFDATDNYQCTRLTYGNSLWVLCGRDIGTSPNPPVLASSSTVNGTYTFYTSSSETGHSAPANIEIIEWDGTDWVSVTTTDVMKVSTALTSGWASPTGAPTGTSLYLKAHSSGYWTVRDTGGTDGLWYATDPAASWTKVDIVDFDMGTTVVDIANGLSTWVAVGIDDDPGSPGDDLVALSYLTTASPDGAYTKIDPTGFTATTAINTRAVSVDFGNGVFVALASASGELRYWPPATGPALLRQRQSPRRSPSRVGSYHLRQRQTPYIR